MAKRTAKFRNLLAKQKEAMMLAMEKVFYSVEIILDNVDQEYEQRESEANLKKGEYENKDQAKSGPGTENKTEIWPTKNRSSGNPR